MAGDSRFCRNSLGGDEIKPAVIPTISLACWFICNSTPTTCVSSLVGRCLNCAAAAVAAAGPNACDAAGDVERGGSLKSALRVLRGTSETYLRMVTPEWRARIRILLTSNPAAAHVCAPVTLAVCPPKSLRSSLYRAARSSSLGPQRCLPPWPW